MVMKMAMEKLMEGYKKTIKSGENGEFRVRGLEKGEYTIYIPEYGYEVTIDIDAGEEQLNILIDLLAYIKESLPQTGYDISMNIILGAILITLGTSIYNQK